MRSRPQSSAPPSTTPKRCCPGVSVTATDQAAGRQIVAITNERGEYRLLNMPPGKYTVQAELAGFSMVVLRDVELLVGQNATIPFTMKLAQVSETLTVVGETPLVDTTSSQVTGNVDRRQMEELPLQGRNWMELSKLVKGITANDVGNTPGVSRDDDFQLNLDGQQITQKVAGSGFGQPKFSRESIAEFQIVTNMFDITQGRSAGMQVQAISRSGTNTMAGSFYGYFRDDKFNAPDPVANRVLPYQNQQIGGTFGGPIVKDKIHYFASYEYEREPGTIFTTPVARCPARASRCRTRTRRRAFSGASTIRCRRTIACRSAGRSRTWRIRSSSAPALIRRTVTSPRSRRRTSRARGRRSSATPRCRKSGWLQHFDWTTDSGRWPDRRRVQLRRPDRGQGLQLPAAVRSEQLVESRYDLSIHKDAHDLKIGGEFIYVKNTGDWCIQRSAG